MNIRPAFIIFALLAGVLQAAPPSKAVSSEDDDFVIRKPGEITFTTGIVIEGRVEKPQVMLILTKEKTKLAPIVFERSFINKITEPVSFSTFEVGGKKAASEDLLR